MKNLTLTFVERLRLFDIVGAQRGDIAQMRIPNRILDKVDPPEEERRAAILRVIQRNDGTTAAEINPALSEVKKTVSLEEAEADVLSAILTSWKADPRSTRWAEGLVGKLKKENQES
jgi:hypothetical protein